ncbi:flagellar protein FliS [Denitrovibrio acetiphilus DSM 12809]|uniref:Flagellar secretion chaperone FliS n=1 Tax=Denitrovibrio acetiphilus (strain DSM 12809 / NBRC 114555 / N2460) TaxID=522772 RepID=D4H873_DENA2|nr:flagellar export chaperone FliS [Denitrovibrio acetiphilus]ADD68222.1 flagellar protein FliS [Denitrovibrio acetiphilus DSM 12809]
MQSPYKNYIKQEVEGATKGKLVLLMYDGAIKFLRVAVKAVNENNIPDAHNNIMKAQNIIYELMSTLNMEAGDVAKNLMRLYDFMIWQLVEANKEKDNTKIESVIKLMSSLREAWKEVVQKEEGSVKQEPEETKSINFAG